MGAGNSPCAACKLLRRRCAQDCIFAPFFPSDDPHKFAIVHKVFGASNVAKMLQDLPFHQRADAVSSLVYEANARMRDPVYGCVGAISYLQNQVSQLQMQLAMAQAEILCIQMQLQEAPPGPGLLQTQQILDDHGGAGGGKPPFLLDGTTGHLAAVGLPHQLVSFAASSAGSAVAPEALKRESLWT